MYHAATHRLRWLVPSLVLGLLLAGCGGDDDAAGVEESPGAAEEPEDAGSESTEVAGAASEVDDPAEGGLEVVVTTSILGDIVSELVGDDGTVTVIMPPGADPHGFEPSAQHAAQLREADLVVANGLRLEESLVSLLDAVEAEGGRVFTLADKLDPIESGSAAAAAGHDDHDDAAHDDGHDDGHDEDGHDEDGHDDDGHDDDGHDDGHDEDGHDAHDHGPEDPHVWFDPVRMADGVELLAAELAAVDTVLDDTEWAARAEAYRSDILAVHEELLVRFEAIPTDNRVLVTNHDALGYLAHRYDFEILGTVVPGASTQVETDARAFAELIETVEQAGVTAIFAENTDATDLAEQLASEVIGRGDLEIDVIRLYTDGLGEPGSGAETYLGLLRTDGELIAAALG